MPVPAELQVRGQSKVGRLNWNSRATVADLVQALGTDVAAPAAPVVEVQTRDNMVAVLASEHGALVLGAADTQVDCAPGTVFSRPSTIRASCRITGAWFKGTDAQTLVAVTDANTTVIFQGCRFTKPSGTTGNYVTLVAGARAHFIGCLFDGVQTVGNVVSNAGLPAAAFSIGCSNKTTRLHANVTTIAETT